uniref:Uncharacterized protein n=2 Tax=Caenorhabditis japonica TaxID=281687 RepID=A0A8R1J3J4_CAEJA
MTITINERISSLAAQLLVAENGDVAIYNLLCLNAPLDVLQKYKIKSLVEPYSELGHFQEEAKLLIERIRRMEEKVEDADMDKENMNSNPRKRKSSSEGLKIRIKIPKMCVPALSPDEFYEMHRDRIEHLSGIDLLHFSLQHQYLDEHLEKHFEKVLKLEFPLMAFGGICADDKTQLVLPMSKLWKDPVAAATALGLAVTPFDPGGDADLVGIFNPASHHEELRNVGSLEDRFEDDFDVNYLRAVIDSEQRLLFNSLMSKKENVSLTKTSTNFWLDTTILMETSIFRISCAP